jgi:hypothetical protein
MRTHGFRILPGVEKRFMKVIDRWLVLLADILLLQTRHYFQYISLQRDKIPRETKEWSFAP